MFKKKNKYSAIKQTYNGRVYHSKKECEVNGIKICNYYMDFKVIHLDGSVELIEVKGYKTDVWKIKWKLTEVLINEIEPNAKLTLIL